MRRFPLFFALVLVACGETETVTVLSSSGSVR